MEDEDKSRARHQPQYYQLPDLEDHERKRGQRDNCCVGRDTKTKRSTTDLFWRSRVLPNTIGQSMTSTTVTFVGNEHDDHGLPKPYCHYYIAASDNTPHLGHATATIVCLSSSPVLQHANIICQGPGSVALEIAILTLAALPENQPLRQSTGCVFVWRDTDLPPYPPADDENGQLKLALLA